MKIIGIREMNSPGEDAINEFHKTLAKIVYKKLGYNVCSQIISLHK